MSGAATAPERAEDEQTEESAIQRPNRVPAAHALDLDVIRQLAPNVDGGTLEFLVARQRAALADLAVQAATIGESIRCMEEEQRIRSARAAKSRLA